MMDKNFSIQPREPLLEKQYPRPLGKNDKCLEKKVNLAPIVYQLVAQPDDLSDIDIWMSMSIYFQIQVTEKYSTAMCYPALDYDTFP